ncbi:unnamed protein product, partial [Choristocarpus tenellus]
MCSPPISTSSVFPDCAVCDDGFAPGLSYSCSECDDSRKSLALGIGIFSLALIVLVVSGGIRFLITASSLRLKNLHGGLSHRIKRMISFQGLKILVVTWQIVTQFSEVANASYPDQYQKFLNIIDFINFDVLWWMQIFSAGCVVTMDFYDSLLLSTLGP